MFFGGVPGAAVPYLQQQRLNQVESLDFVGCVKSLSVNGYEKNILGGSLNSSGIGDTCNQIEGGACNGGDECGGGDNGGRCVPLWSYHKCECGSVVAPDCGPSFQPFSLTETQEIHFWPTDKYRRAVALRSHSSSSHLDSGRWKREEATEEHSGKRSISLAFRTLKENGVLLTALGAQASSTVVEIVENKLLYRSQLAGKPEINMTSGIAVTDGQWHTVRLEESGGGGLNMKVDGLRVGYEIEYSAAHDFLDAGMDRFVLGSAAAAGFRGCMGNFTVNDELQTLGSDSHSLLRADVPAGVFVDGCDIQILQSAQAKNAVDVGITVIIVFFVLLICAVCLSYTFFKLRKRWRKQKEAANTSTKGGVYDGGYSNAGMDLQQEHHQMELHNSHQQQQQQQQHPVQLNNAIQYRSKMRPTNNKPDILDQQQLNNFVGEEDALYGDPVHGAASAEHYDLENASSIAPSDIDVVYHYKGYRDGSSNRHHRYNNSGGKSLSSSAKKRSAYLKHQNTPLARLSPSSEMSRNTPRILTLGDLSGKPLPPVLALQEQSERSMNSPVSHSSSHSHRIRHHHQTSSSPHHRGLTSENVARFNGQRATPQKSALVNTMDMVGMESRKAKTPTIDDDRRRSSSSSSSSSSSGNSGGGDDDSFTCSEFEYDCQSQNNNATLEKDMSDASLGAMVFNKLIGGSENKEEDEEDDDDEAVMPSAGPPGKTWESLLNWMPDYSSFAGVFRDIAELPHSSSSGGSANNSLDPVMCRPTPVGLDHQMTEARNEEEYI